MSETQAQRRERQDRIARAALPRLNGLADDLEAMATEFFAKRVPYEPDNGAEVMAQSFVTKQVEHLRSVRTLIAAGSHRDAHLIARTMIEGMARLLGAFNKVPERTELWLWFGAILDWRQTLANDQSGVVVDPREKAELRKLVDKHGPNYYTEKVRNAIGAAERQGTAYELPADPWGNNWTDVTIKSMFREVEGEGIYAGVYGRSSEWIHWGPRSIFRAMEPAEWGTNGFSQEDWGAATEALWRGCQSLLQTLEVLDHHFSRGRAERLAELDAAMVTMLNEALEAAG